MAEKGNALTDRELEIVRLVATGATNRQIARELVISVNTVKVHLKNIFTKLEIQSRTEVAMYAVSQGWVDLELPLPAAEAVESRPQAAVAEPISWRRRVFLVLAVLSAALLALLPEGASESTSSVSSEFADRGTSTDLGSPALEPYRWSSMAPLPTLRSRFAAAYFEDKVYVIAGDSVDGATGLVEVYDPSTNGWRAGSPKPVPVSNVAAAVVAGKIYVAGGFTASEEVIADLEIYDPASDSWEPGAPLPLPLCAYAVGVVDQKMYLFGGWTGSAYLPSTYEYDTATDTWSEKSPMPSARGFAGAGVVDGKVYVVGGFDGREEFATVEEYDPALDDGEQDPWSAKPSMLMRRGGLGVASVGNTVYAIGGGWHGYLAYNERYDPTTETWSMIDTPVFGEWRNLGVTASDKRIYAIGGWNGHYLNVNQEYQALFTYYLPELP
jgi:DNA-binding CsgD family transcriptional regulator